MNKTAKMFLIIFSLIFVSILLHDNKVYASTYDNAYTFYEKYAKDSEKPVHLNKDDGYIYFCSWGATATSGVRYKTVGYSIRINVNGKNDTVEVKLGGNIVKNVSTVEKGKYTYVLRKAKLCRLQSLFSGNSDITWNDIFRKKNTYDFNAIMTVSENGTDLCGTVSESSNLRTISANNNLYLYRTLSGIKNARNWTSPDDLDNFFGKKVSLEPVSPLDVSDMNIVTGSDNIYPYNNSYYIRYGSDIVLYFDSLFDDAEAVSMKYHPNYNVYKVTGWGDNDVYFEKQSFNNRGFLTGIAIGSDGAASPMRVQSVDNNSTSYESNPLCYRSSVRFNFCVPDSGTIYVKPEGRVYYNNRFPEDENDNENLCDNKVNSEGKITLSSDGIAPEITVNTSIFAFSNSYVTIPVTVNDNLSGIRSVYLYKNNGILVDSLVFSEKTDNYSSGKRFYVRAVQSDTYYVAAVDNVGNRRTSQTIRFNMPSNYVITAKASGGKNDFNTTKFDINVSGGSSQICTFLIYSDPEYNPEESRIIIENRNIFNNTLKKGLYRYDYNEDIMDYIRYYKDGVYIFDIVSGGELTGAETKSLTVLKDTIGPDIRYYVDTVSNNGWFRKNVDVKADITDEFSGADTMELFCNGEIMDGTINQYVSRAPIYSSYKICEEGINNILIKAYDYAGNMSIRNETVCIDKTPPYLELSERFEGIETAPGRWFNKDGFEGNIIIRDLISGVIRKNNSGILYIDKGTSLNMVPYSDYEVKAISDDKLMLSFTDEYKDNIETSTKTYMLGARDAAGNETTKFLYLRFDCDSPIVDTVVSDPWNPLNRKGNIKISDIHSGLRKITVYKDSNIIYKDYYEGMNEKVINLDLHDLTVPDSLIRLEIEDMVGNTTNYVLETAKDENTGINIRTRLR